jgi:hypothetical protein
MYVHLIHIFFVCVGDFSFSRILMGAPSGETDGPIQFCAEDEVELSGDVRLDHVTPEPFEKRSRVDAPRKPVRKRVASPRRWKMNEAAVDLSVDNDFLDLDSLRIDKEIEDNDNNISDGTFIFFIN